MMVGLGLSKPGKMVTNKNMKSTISLLKFFLI